jgi:hypothetical protein
MDNVKSVGEKLHLSQKEVANCFGCKCAYNSRMGKNYMSKPRKIKYQNERIGKVKGLACKH